MSVRKSLWNADYALYVTEEFLQRRYPCKNKTVGVSDVVIDEISDEVRQRRNGKIAQIDSRNITLMTSGAVNVWYKGQHFVIRAIPLLNKMGIHVKYYCVGQGDSNYLTKIAQKCGVEDQVVFTGPVSHDEVFRLLDKCDIYVQPSLQEGLPRALVEAMSRGCPAIGARTGGIPELLPSDCIVRRKSVRDIAKTIKRMLDDGLTHYSDQSFLRAQDFQEEKLDVRRNAYFKYVCDSIGKTGE
jgi:glycosyltransferase involved in cell wall biosynthesis